ncbi:hypothetical protein [Leifsonia sp. NPDC058248]|uniref:hypothetical protein n=1 Tax=Leifsonia sp. NPDC058248 TaxID=3346402 RepID=UPI0036D9136D
MTEMAESDGTTTDAAQQGTTQPGADEQTAGEQAGGAAAASESDATADAGERPGDIPFEQAAAEHENPALE